MNGRAQQYWDGVTTTGTPGVITGGSGVWDSGSNNTTNWTTSTGTPNAQWGDTTGTGTVAVFTVANNISGTYTVTFDGGFSFAATQLNFLTGGYTLVNSEGFLLYGANNINTAQGSTNLNISLSSTGVISKTGAGQLILSADNTQASQYSGPQTQPTGGIPGITLNQGSIVATNTNALGGSGSTVTLTASRGLQNYLQISSGGSSFSLGSNVTVSGTGAALIISDTDASGITNSLGTLSLNGNGLVNINNDISGNTGLSFTAVNLAGTRDVLSSIAIANGNLVTLGSVTGTSSNFVVGGNGSVTITGSTNLGSGNLVKFNSGTLTLNGAVTTTGSIIITQEKAGNVLLQNSGVFAGSQNILVNGGALTLSTSNSGTVVDFLPTASLTLAGANVIVTQLAANQSNVLGSLNLGAGASGIYNTGYATSGAQTFVFSNLGSRAQGSTINFGSSDRTYAYGQNGAVQITGSVTLTNGMIGGWAITGSNNFATMSGTDVISITPTLTTTSDFSGVAGAADNVELDIPSGVPTTSVVLSGNSTINSLHVNGQQPNDLGILDLGGHTLALSSGGIILGGSAYNTGYTVADGNLTAGTTSSPAELFVYLGNQGGSLDVNLGSNITDNGAGGSVSLVVSGYAGQYSSNSLHLSGLNSYTGNTYLNTGGRIDILTDRQFGAEPSALNAGNITLGNGSTIAFQDYIVPEAISSNRGIVLTAGGGSISIGNDAGSGALEMPISGTGAFSFTTISSATRTTIAGSSTYDGVTSIGGGNSAFQFTSIGNIGGGASSLGAPTTAANGRIIVTGINEGLAYVGTGAATTDRQFEFDTINSGNGQLSASGAGALTLNGNVLINASGNSLYLAGYGIGIINGNILQTQSSPSSIVLDHPYQPADGGIWRFTGENTFAGSITIGNSKTLEFNTVGNVGSGPSSLGAPTDVSDGTINLNGGTLRFIGTTAQSTDRVLNVTNNSGLQTTGSAPITFIGGASIGGYRTLTLGGTGQGYFSGSGIISGGNAGLAMQGTAGQGTWTLNQNAVNTFTGGVSVNSGNLVLDFSNLSTPTNLVDSSNSLTLGGGNLTIQGKSGQAVSQTFSSWSLNSDSGSVINLKGASAASVTLNLSNFYRNGGSSLDVETTGSATVNVGSIGLTNGLLPYMTFNGNNFATVNGGVLGAFTAYTGSLTSSTTGAGGNTYNLVGGLVMSNGGNDVNLSALKITAGAGGQSLDLGGHQLVANGQTGILYDGTSNNYTYTISNGTVDANGTGELDIQVAAGTLNIAAAFAANYNDFVKGGTGTLILSGTNSFNDRTDIDAGTLMAGSDTGIVGQGDVYISAAGVLATNGFSVSILDANGTGIIQNGASTASTLTLGAADMGVSGYPTAYYYGGTFNGIIQDGGTGSLSLVKSGSGYQILSEAYNAMNTYSGSTTVLSGYLNIDFITDTGTASSIGTGSQINLGSNGQMGVLQIATSLTANQESNRSITLATGGTGAVDVVGSGGVLGGGTQAEFAANGDLYGALLTLSGNINGGGTLLKLGLGNLDLSGANSYTGGTAVEFGMLRFDTAASVPASGLITVYSGGTVGTKYAINQAFLNQVNSASTGVVALGGDSSNNLDFTNLGSAALGAMGHNIFSGSLTPNSAAGYQLGGGGPNDAYEANHSPDGPNSALFIANANTITGNNNVTVSPHGTAGAAVIFDDTQNFTGTLTVAGGFNANQILPNDYPNNGSASNYSPGWEANASLTLAGGQLPNVSGIVLNPLGNLTVVLGATSANSLPSTLPITFNGGGLAFENDSTQNSVSNSNYSQTLGAINLVRGSSELFSQAAQTGFTSTLTFASINRSAGATITFIGSTTYIYPNTIDLLGTSSVNEIVITNTGTLSTTLATPWAFYGGGSSYGNSDQPTDFAIISNTGSFGSIQAANGAVITSDASLAGGDYTLANSSSVSLSADRSANTIRMNANSDKVISLNGHTLSVNGVLNVGQNGYGGSNLTIGSSVGDGNLTAVTGSHELILNPATEWFNSPSDITVDSNVIDNGGSVTLVKAGIGDLTLAGNNTFTGGIVANGEGSLIFTNSNAFGSGSITLNGGSVQLASGIAANTVIANNWVVNADATILNNINASGLTLTGSIAINGPNTTLYWMGNRGQNQLLNGAVSGSGNLVLQGDYGTISLGGSANNTYTGLTSITGRPDGSSPTVVSLEKTGTATAIAGNILLGGNSVVVNQSSNPQQELLILNQGNVANWSANNIASTSVITFQGGNGFDAGVFQMNGNNQTLGGIQSATAGDGLVQNNSNNAGTSVLTLNTTGTTNYTYGGLVQDHDRTNNNAGTLAVTKSGSGTQSFTNSNTYSGGTTVNSGSLYANNTSGSATGSGTISVATGATLGGTGTLINTSGAANLINGNIAVGQGFAGDLNTIKVLTMQASVGTTFSGANLTFNLSTTTLGQGTELAVGSSPNVLFNGSNTLTFDLQGTSIIPTSSTYVLFTSTVGGSNLGSSVFGGTGITLGAGNVINGLNLNFVNGTADYSGSTLQLVSNGTGGYNIDLNFATVAVPEPGTWVLMLGGLALLVAYQRARRFKNDL
jgi:autotransporter-associated beta strand protein